ncbi:MAG: hypothetical protein ABJN34_15215 [Litoreibacter sp.]
MLSVSTLTLGLTLGLGTVSVDAQNLRSDNGPAETPPASFKGKQYVDSRGCVYIRAGFSGNVNWIPRVTRSRQLVCGAQPSLRPPAQTAKAAPKTAPKAAPKTAVRKAKASSIPAGAKVIKKTTTVVPAPKVKTTTKVVRKASAAPKAQTRVVRQTVAKPQTRVVRQTVAKPQTRVVRRAVAAPKPQTRVVTKVAPAAQTKIVRKQVRSKPATKQPTVVYRCGASEFSSQFINNGARCNPQTGKVRSVVREEISPQSRNTQGQRVGPKGVNRRIAEAREIKAPAGHKVAWDDDRLNPLRGVGTTSGKAQMQLVWSNTVPRYLIDPATGKRAR